MNILGLSGKWALLMALIGGAIAPSAASAAAGNFSVASVHLEQNATDGDMEIVFEVTGKEDGLTELTITGPDGRQMAAFKAPDASTLGIREFRFESPEPRDVKSLKTAYPEGVYEFSGKTVGGDTLVGKATLSHRLPPAPKFLRPSQDDMTVPPRGLTISWKRVEVAASYIINISKIGANANLTATLPASSTSFAVPQGFLSGGKYTVALSAVARDGNVSLVETSVMTEKYPRR
jgi:hypothetical protein